MTFNIPKSSALAKKPIETYLAVPSAVACRVRRGQVGWAGGLGVGRGKVTTTYFTRYYHMLYGKINMCINMFVVGSGSAPL